MARIATLLTVYNRREKTLKCLEACFLQIDELKADGRYDFDVYLVDDGCTDGTSEAVKEAFPQVKIIRRADGNLYWNGGMRLAWEEAARQDYDFYLWINDDTFLLDGALSVLLDNSGFLRHRAIIAGTAKDSKGNLSYGGRTKNNKLIEPDPAIPVTCFMFNGNLVLVPKYAYDRIGNLSPVYQHTFGDYDYGIRARKNGVPCVVAPGILAICDRDHGIAPWRSSKYTLRQRIAFRKSPKGRPAREQFIFDTRLKGLFYAIGHGVSILLKCYFPKRNYNES